jgi:hypothetical protein
MEKQQSSNITLASVRLADSEEAYTREKKLSGTWTLIDDRFFKQIEGKYANKDRND